MNIHKLADLSGVSPAELRTAQAIDDGEDNGARFEAWIGGAHVAVTGDASDVARIVIALVELLP